MKNLSRSISIILAIAIAAAPFTACTPGIHTRVIDVSVLTPDPEIPVLQTFDTGPGTGYLSLGGKFHDYQWALKNKGGLQIIESDSSSDSADIISQRGSGQPEADGLAESGVPEPFITHAVPGTDINILPAWDLYAQAENKRPVLVAIIDTGVDYKHPDLQHAIWNNPGEIPGDGIDNDGNGYADDIHGWNFYHNNNEVYEGEEDSHGTHAAGTISAAGGPNGMMGITDNQFIKIMPLKALGGPEGTGSAQAVIDAIHYAETNGASICNLSLGSSIYDERLSQVIRDSGMLFVVASGNGSFIGTGYNTDQFPVFPASLPYDNIISVANLKFDGNLSKESNYGPASVDIAAPGTYILSTIPGDDYGFMSGTSMAAPMVTGVAAMLYSYRIDISLSDVKNILINSARKLDSLDGKILSGGMPDAYAALTTP